ncbi:hypothetical protein TESG_00843 [Trichophyton tonsurans CBS 112818]|uniref:Uncharacterized protein n=1 Tax=Trichophyton tonsurans (strain CBS 112818) TaxID=647933 RepID=F2RPR1_TRIT1|nr:hypothetical protein TESG_00843 [Trichophyton tonsurans CBS 112818]
MPTFTDTATTTCGGRLAAFRADDETPRPLQRDTYRGYPVHFQRLARPEQPFVSPSPSSVGSLAAGWGDPSGSGAAEGDTSKAPAVPGRSKANKRAYHRQFKAQQKPWTLVRAVGCTARQSQEARVQSLSVSVRPGAPRRTAGSLDISV